LIKETLQIGQGKCFHSPVNNCRNKMQLTCVLHWVSYSCSNTDRKR